MQLSCFSGISNINNQHMMSSSLELPLCLIWTKSKRLFLGSCPTRQNVGGGRERWEWDVSKGKWLVFQRDWQFFVDFIMGGCYVKGLVWQHGILRGLEGEWPKQKIKHVTTYQHTLAEGSSTPASCPLSKSPSPDPPVGNLGNRRRWGRRPLRTAGLFWYCRVGFQDPRMAPNHTLKEKKQRIRILIDLMLWKVKKKKKNTSPLINESNVQDHTNTT